MFDEEVSDPEFSDDEEERAYKMQKKQKKKNADGKEMEEGELEDVKYSGNKRKRPDH